MLRCKARLSFRGSLDRDSSGPNTPLRKSTSTVSKIKLFYKIGQGQFKSHLNENPLFIIYNVILEGIRSKQIYTFYIVKMTTKGSSLLQKLLLFDNPVKFMYLYACYPKFATFL